MYTLEKAIQNVNEIFQKVLLYFLTDFHFSNLRCLSHLLKVYFPTGAPEAYSEYAEIMGMLNATDQAAIYYREAGALAHKRSEYSNALKYFKKSLQSQPERCDILWWIGQVYEAQKKKTQAIDQYKAVLECKGVDEDAAHRAALFSWNQLLSSPK
jgi:tetratricopeptide (TPR) repeat protein